MVTTVTDYVAAIDALVIAELDRFRFSWEREHLLEGIQGEDVPQQKTTADRIGERTTACIERIRKNRVGHWQRVLEEAINADGNIHQGDYPLYDQRNYLLGDVKRAGAYISPLESRAFYRDGAFTNGIPPEYLFGSDLLEVGYKHSVRGLFPCSLDYGIRLKFRGPVSIPRELTANGAGSEEIVFDFVMGLPSSTPELTGYVAASTFFGNYDKSNRADTVYFGDLETLTDIAPERRRINDTVVDPRKVTDVRIGELRDDVVRKILQRYLRA